MEEKSLLEEMCDLVFEKAQPQTESYKQNRSNAAEAGERLHKTLTDEQKQLLDAMRRYNAMLNTRMHDILFAQEDIHE